MSKRARRNENGTHLNPTKEELKEGYGKLAKNNLDPLKKACKEILGRKK